MRDRGLDVTLLRCTTVLMTNLKVSKESPPASNRTITSEVHVSEMVEFNAKHSLKTGEHYMKALIDKWLSKANAIGHRVLYLGNDSGRYERDHL